MANPVADSADPLFTDDEFVALVVAIQGRLQVALPTVDVREADDVSAATERGVRSLLVRGLADDDGIAESLKPFAQAIGSGQVLLRTCVIDGDDNVSQHGAQVAVFSSETLGAVVDVVSPTGVHSLTGSSIEDAYSLVAQAIAIANADGLGIDTGSSDVALLVVSGETGQRKAIAVRKSQVELVTFRDGGIERTVTDTSAQDAFAAIARAQSGS